LQSSLDKSAELKSKIEPVDQKEARLGDRIPLYRLPQGLKQIELEKLKVPGKERCYVIFNF
jgi:hypothetical protein